MKIAAFILLLVTLLPSILSAENQTKQEQELFVFDKMITAKFPEKIPPAIPKFIIPENSKYLQSTDLRSGFYTSLEATLVYENAISRKDLDQFLQKGFLNSEWRLLQTSTTEKESIYLAEGFSRKILTILVRPSTGGGTKVNVYFKKNNNY
ncbi:MAG: hypothetical protein MH321_09530 [Leptospiraceae bacterium]|nr:hypothetical protein [Leptospiraceae bacterium]